MKKNKPAESIIAITGGLIVFYLIYKVTVLLFIALGFIAVGLLSSFLSSKIARLWMGLGKMFGYISSRILIGMVFYIILTPLALIRKLFMDRKHKDEKKSNFIVRNHLYSAEDFSRPF